MWSPLSSLSFHVSTMCSPCHLLFVYPWSFSVEPVPSKWGLVMDRLLVLSRKFSDILTKLQVFLWRLLELHILKMVAFFSMWVAVEEVKTGFGVVFPWDGPLAWMISSPLWLFVCSPLWWIWFWWCCGLWRCRTVALGRWPPACPRFGFVSLLCVRCCINSVLSTPWSTPVTVAW